MNYHDITARAALLRLFGEQALKFEGMDEDGDECIEHEELGIRFYVDPENGELLSVVNPSKDALDSLVEHRRPHPRGMISRVVALCEAYGYAAVIECARQEKDARENSGLAPADDSTPTRLRGES